MKYTDAQIVALGCIVCRRHGIYTKAILHHVRKLRTSKKRKLAPVIPLCNAHHKGYGWGISLHDGEKEFERRYGTVDSMLDEVQQILNRRKL